MRNNPWSEHRPADEVHRRAGGRRAYNRLRQIRAAERRLRIAHRLIHAGGLHHGLQANIARDLGVHRSTVCRDIAAIMAGGSAGLGLAWSGTEHR